MTFNERLVELTYNHEKLLERPNVAIEGNGVYERYKYPVLTAEHAFKTGRYIGWYYGKTSPWARSSPWRHYNPPAPHPGCTPLF